MLYTVPEALAVLDGGQQLQPCTLVYAEQKLLSCVRAQTGLLCCRYAFHDDKLPRWFAEDESRHMRPLPQVCVCGGGGVQIGPVFVHLWCQPRSQGTKTNTQAAISVK
jgi:hypothetical protein